MASAPNGNPGDDPASHRGNGNPGGNLGGNADGPIALRTRSRRSQVTTMVVVLSALSIDCIHGVMDKLHIDDCVRFGKTIRYVRNALASYLKNDTKRLRGEMEYMPWFHCKIGFCGQISRDMAWRTICEGFGITGIAARYHYLPQNLHEFAGETAEEASFQRTTDDIDSWHKDTVARFAFIYAIVHLRDALKLANHEDAEDRVEKTNHPDGLAWSKDWAPLVLGEDSQLRDVNMTDYAREFVAAIRMLCDKPAFQEDHLFPPSASEAAAENALRQTPLGKAVDEAVRTTMDFYFHGESSPFKKRLDERILFWMRTNESWAEVVKESAVVELRMV